MNEFKEIYKNIAENENYKNEYRYYGIRFHYAEAKAGEYLECSKIWVDGEATDSLENGVCALDVFEMIDDEWTMEEIIDSVSEYEYGNGSVVIIAGNDMEYGEDRREIIIHDAIVVDVIK